MHSKDKLKQYSDYLGFANNNEDIELLYGEGLSGADKNIWVLKSKYPEMTSQSQVKYNFKKQLKYPYGFC